MRRPVRRLLAAVALFLALLAHPAAAETIQLKKHPGGGYTIPGRDQRRGLAHLHPRHRRLGRADPGRGGARTGTRRQARPRRLHRHADLCPGGRLESPEPARPVARIDGRRPDRVECHREHRPVRQPAAAGAEFSVEIRVLDARQRAQPARPEDQGRRRRDIRGRSSAGPGGSPGAAGSGSTYGAFAHDETSGRYGASWNQASQARADEAALKGCASEWCKIVFRITARQCGAIAMTDNGKIWGGATRPDRAAAERAAVENCEKRTSRSCRPRSVQCNR